ncbi:ferric reductase-like transmembrane domain-containing protein [Candidatus Saccharibacteria bacterium]|jgi:sulfoxide reductase heme-binding subunit YedZ|nr:ferric reductase-like transmembrane domain-containing protein [Candidatus Saccharibacteria bacterium]
MRNILIFTLLILGLASVLPSLATDKTAAADDPIVKVEQLPESSVARGLSERATSSWPWYLTRASGLVAALAFVILMLSGVGLISGRTFSFFEPLTAWATHRALGIVLAVSTVVHVGALFFDSFEPFGIIDLLVPFASDYKTIDIFGIYFGSLYVALGVLALYIIAAITIASLLWIDKMPRLWKFTHILSYLAMILVFVHALYLGTDLATGLLRWVWIVSAFIVLFASFSRLWRAKTV